MYADEQKIFHPDFIPDGPYSGWPLFQMALILNGTLPYILHWHQSQLRNMDRDSKTSNFHRQILKETIQDFKHFHLVQL